MDFSSIFSSLVSSTAGFSTNSCFFSGLAVLAGQQERRARDVDQSNRVLPLWSLGVQTAGAWDHLSSGGPAVWLNPWGTGPPPGSVLPGSLPPLGSV